MNDESAKPRRGGLALAVDLRRARAARRREEKAAEAEAAPREPLECVREWFKSEGWEPFEFQEKVWRAYLTGESGLVHAATGTGKTYAAWMGPIAGPEMEAVRPILELQAKWSRIPAPDELLIERVQTREGHHLFFYPVEGRLVHEGLAALFAYRLAQLGPITFTLAANDYGFELLSPDPARLEEALEAGLVSPDHLLHDIPASLNAAELAKRQFREIARVAGLIFQGYPGNNKSVKQVQASSGLLYDVFARYDPENLLLFQAHREVLEKQLERSRLGRALERIAGGRVTISDVDRPTPLAFALLVDRAREQVSSEKFLDRVKRLLTPLERAATKGNGARHIRFAGGRGRGYR